MPRSLLPRWMDRLAWWWWRWRPAVTGVVIGAVIVLLVYVVSPWARASSRTANVDGKEPIMTALREPGFYWVRADIEPDRWVIVRMDDEGKVWPTFGASPITVREWGPRVEPPPGDNRTEDG